MSSAEPSRIFMRRINVTQLLMPLGLLLSMNQCFCLPHLAMNKESMKEILIRSDYIPGELTKLCDLTIKKAKNLLDEIVNTPNSQQSLKGSLIKLENITAEFSDTTQPLCFMGYVSPNEALSKEGSECEQRVSQFLVNLFTRKDLYQCLQGNAIQKKELNANESKLLSEILKKFQENGLMLSEEKAEEVKILKEKLALIESQFSNYLNQDRSTVEFTLIELEGVPEAFISSLEKTGEGKYVVTTKEPHYIRIIENAKHSETRKIMQEAFENRAAFENTKLLEEAIQLRQKIADLIGFKNWVDYRLQFRMAQTSTHVLGFLNELREKLSKRNKTDLEKLLKFKQEIEPLSKTLDAWDIRYLAYQLKKRDLNLDTELIREYFPAAIVVSELFNVYSQLLGVQFSEDKAARVWADGVKLYKITDQKDKHVIGYFYADFIPRQGKYGHAAAFSLISGRLLENGQYSNPVSAIIANFSPPENGKPVLLSHDEVVTLFHEFGHIMHQTLTQAPYASLSGSSVDRDFVEAPSQMLENWAYSAEILNLVSGHYQDKNRKLPAQIIQKLVESRDFNQGYSYTRQLLFGLLDLNYHMMKGEVDTSQIYRKLHQEIIGIDAIKNSHFQASFGHLMGGYDAGYYGYLWSLVYAADMFTKFEKAGLRNPEVGLLYRKTVLEQGKMVDAFQILEEFLGRKPNFEAFYKNLHIE